MHLLKEVKFISVLVKGFGTGGGSEEENSDVIKYALLNMNTFITSLQGSKFRECKPQRRLNKGINEHLEEEGGNEEIQNWMFQSKEMNRDVSSEAISVYKTKSYKEVFSMQVRHIQTDGM
ncbi:MAG: hypothetical protein EZS28_051592, partial [Streblomastix strix]